MSPASQQHSSLANDTAFGKFTRIAVGVTEAVIHAQVALPIADSLYRKNFVAQHFVRQIKQLVEIDFFSTGDFITTVASYFDIDTNDYDSHSVLLHVAAALSKLKVDFTRQEKGVFHTLDDFFCGYMDYIPLMPAAVDQWGFHLTLFFQVL